LLVSGPFKINGVPLKRVNQAYVIATSTSVDLSSVKLPATINDAYFAKDKSAAAKGEEKFFENESKAAIVSDSRKKDQATVDSALLKVVAKTPLLKQYLNAKFSLTNKDRPHSMVF
jgi:large subunit ribosomal protein L6e